MLALENQRLVEEIKRLGRENDDLRSRIKSSFDPNLSRNLSASPGRPSLGENEAKELMRKLASERVQVETHNSHLQEENDRLHDEINSLRSQLNSLAEGSDGNYQLMANELNEYKLLAEEQRGDLTRFAVLLKEREDHIELLERELAGMPKDKVNQELVEWNKRYATVRKSNLEGLNQLTTERNELASELSKQNQRNFELQNELNSVKRVTDPKTKEELRMAQASIEEIEREWNKRYAQLEQENRRLRSQMPSQRNSFSPSKGDFVSEERIRVLEQENLELRHQLGREKSEGSDVSFRVKTEIERMNNELIYYREKVQELELLMIERDRELQRAKDSLTPSRKSVFKEDPRIQALEREKSELIHLLDLEKQNSSRVNSSYLALEERNKQMRASLKPDGRKLLEQLMEKENLLQIERERNEKFLQDIEFLEKENLESRVSRPVFGAVEADRNEDIVFLEGEIARLTEQVAYEQNKSVTLSDRLQDLESENNRLNLTMRAKEDFEFENQELRKTVESLKFGDNRRLAEQASKLQEDLAVEKEKNRQLQHELSEREQENRNLNSKIASLAHELPTPQERASCIRASISGVGVKTSIRPSMRPSLRPSGSAKSSFYGKLSSRYSTVRGSQLPRLSPVGKSGSVRPSAPDIQISGPDMLETQGITFQEELEAAEMKAISDHFKERSDMLEAENQELLEEISRLRMKVNSMEDIRTENNSLREALDSLRIRSPAEFQRLTEEVEKMNLLLRNERDKVHRLEAEILEKEHEMQTLQQSLDNAFKKSRVSTVRKSEMGKVVSDVEQLSINLRIEAEQKTALQSRTEDLEFELNRLVTRNKDLEEANEMLNSLNASLKSGIDWQVREQIDRLNAQLEEARGRNLDLEERMRDQDRMVRKSRISTPRKSRLSMADNFDKSQRLEEDIEELRGLLEAERKAKQDALSQASRFEREISALSMKQKETLNVSEESARYRQRYESVRQNTPASVFALTQDIENLEKALKKEKEAKVVCETNLFARENEVARLNAQLAEKKNLEKEISVLNNQVEDFKYEIGELREALIESEEKIAYLEKVQPTSAVRVSRQPSPNRAKDDTVDQEEFRAQFEILEQEWSQRYQELETEFNRLRYLEDENKALVQENNGFREKLTSVSGLKEFNLIQENVTLNTEIQNMKKALAANEEDMRGLTVEHSKFTALKREVASLKDEKRILEEKCDSLAQALSDKDGRLGDLKRLSTFDTRREVEYYKSKLRELEAILDEQSKILGSIERLASLEEENVELRKSEIALREKYESTKKQNELLLTQNILLAMALDSQTDQHLKLDSSYSSRMRDYETQVKKRSSVASDQLDSVITLKKALENESRDLRDRLHVLKNENVHLRGSVTAFTDEKSRIERELVDLRDDSKRQITDWETKFRLLEERHIREIEELQSNLEAFRSSMLAGPQDISNERTAYEILIEELRDRLKVVEEELLHKDRELVSLRDYLSKAEGDFGKGSYYGLESNTLYRELEETKSSLERMRRMREDNEGELMTLKDRLSLLEKTNSSLVNEVEDLRSEKREISHMVISFKPDGTIQERFRENSQREF